MNDLDGRLYPGFEKPTIPIRLNIKDNILADS